MGTHWKGTAREKRALDSYIRLMRCAWTVQGRLDRRLEAHGVTETQFGVLETLEHLGPLSAQTLASRQFTSGGNLTYVLDQLEKRGWVRRERDETDRRVVRIFLRPAGRAFVTKILPGQVDAIVEVFGALSPSEQERLGLLCKKLGMATRAAS